MTAISRLSSLSALTVAVLLTLWTSTSLMGADVFKMFDWNEDGVLSGNEAKPFLTLDFEPSDEPDGEITRKEFDAGLLRHRKTRSEQIKAIFDARDTNEDDRLSGTEINGYQFADEDGNGRITLEELDRAVRIDAAKLKELAYNGIVEFGVSRFNWIDTNEDGKLTGSEARGLSQWDTDHDQKILLGEFMANVFLDAAVGEDLPPPPIDVKSGDLMLSVVEAINGRDGRALQEMFRPELNQIVDSVIIQYLTQHVFESHGKISPPSNDQVEIKDAGREGQYLHVAQLRCDKGKVSIVLTVFDNALLGIDLKSPQIEKLHEKMFADLLADRNELLSRFAKFYSKSCEVMIRHIIAKEDTAAFEMFHPDIQKQVGDKPFLEIFRTIRNQCGTQSVQVELESAGVDFDENNKGKFFTISHRLSGPKGKVLVTHNMQFVGLKAFFVAMSIEPVKDESDAPTNDGADLPSAVDTIVPPKP
ncbi:EF hand [Pirellula sp. SH-Sr6A]|uniref:hypothetical protein n=1 Tax=Pirellula sp. SH-Sr6A TaxID=1632865 RepID=UPI00078CE01C|nr:hypothetical protein [Pirellula sp. SH-Sr6A]AMV33724.1 EF hand [Pirellula sp. SH-Sr6A]